MLILWAEQRVIVQEVNLKLQRVVDYDVAEKKYIEKNARYIIKHYKELKLDKVDVATYIEFYGASDDLSDKTMAEFSNKIGHSEKWFFRQQELAEEYMATMEIE